jgi:parallel beta-helix repeat protein
LLVAVAPFALKGEVLTSKEFLINMLLKTEPKKMKILQQLFLVAAASLPVIACSNDTIPGLYITYFNRAPDKSGLAYWESQANTNGATQALYAISSAFALNSVALINYPSSMTDSQFVTRMYNYALGVVTPDAAGLNYWLGRLTAGQSRTNLIVEFIDGVLQYNAAKDTTSTAAEKQAALDAQTMVKNKVAAALYFATDPLGTGDKSNVPLDASGNPDVASVQYLASVDVLSGVTKDPATLDASYLKSQNYRLTLPSRAECSATVVSNCSCAPAPTSSLVANVRDMGASGNGSTDDTAAIQAAVDRVSGSGGTVFVPDGTYLVDAATSIRLGSKMTFRMSNNAILKAMPTGDISSRLIRIMDKSDVNVIGGTLMGERYAHTGTTDMSGDGISIAGVSNIVVEGVTAKDFWEDGFYVTEWNGIPSKNVKICNVIADNNRRQGMSIVSADGVIVRGSIFKNTNGTDPMAGIDIEPNLNQTVSNVQVLNSQMLSNQGYGIELTYGTALIGKAFINNVTIDGNTVADNIKAGISISKTSGHRVSNNIVKNHSLDDGIDLMSGASSNMVTGNTVLNNKVIGILMYGGAANNTVTNNTVTGNIKANIKDYVGGNTISGNNAP